MKRTYSISGSRVILPDGPVENRSVRIDGKRFVGVGRGTTDDLVLEPDLIVLPALINVHDHLRGTYLPRIGPPQGEFYLKCSNWERDLRRSEVVAERSLLSVDDCYLLGSYKNILSGVATVNDHFPHEENRKIIPLLPLRVIQNYTLAHEASSYNLDWGDGIEVEHKRARKKDYPFIIHMEEGFDEEYQRGIELLEDMSSLDDHNVLIHCLGFSEKDIQKVNKLGCSVVWCPASNFFMFNVTCKIKKILETGVNCALGTDSTHTGSINLFEEIRFGREMYRKMYGEELSGRKIFEMVTLNAARAFRMERTIGSIEDGKMADLLVLRSRGLDAYDALVQAQIEDIELLTLEGVPIFGSEEYKDFFGLKNGKYTDIKIKGKRKFAKGDPLRLLQKVREKVGYKKTLDFLPLDD
jgi:cytosine/adenosine deaminase-related metal-dependent hydrolase